MKTDDTNTNFICFSTVFFVLMLSLLTIFTSFGSEC